MENIERPEWQTRLKEEYLEIKERQEKLEAFINDKNVKLNRKEWKMLEEQSWALANLGNILKDRCDYYNLL